MLTLEKSLGPSGETEIIEFLRDGSRLYLEEGVRQSQATAEGESAFSYIRIMECLLLPAAEVLVLGCGGGTLATSLTRHGKRVTVVDVNPTSFALARRYFGLPSKVTCVTSDFRSFVRQCGDRFDGIAVDVGGPGFSFRNSFDELTCALIRSRLAGGGRIVMNMLVAHDLDGLPDTIAHRLCGQNLNPWIVDEPSVRHRNAVIACVPEKVPPFQKPLVGADHGASLAASRNRSRSDVARPGPARSSPRLASISPAISVASFEKRRSSAASISVGKATYR